VLRISRALAVAGLVAIAAGCGGSHSTAPTTPTTTQRTSTVPKHTFQLVAQNFPSVLTGSVTFNVNRTQGNPKKPEGWRRRYTVTLDDLVLRLAGTQGKGDKRKARYTLASAHEVFTGFEDITNSKCKTTHIVWAGSGKAPTGTVEIFSPKFDADVGFAFDVPQRGNTLTRSCKASSGGTKNTVTRTAQISGNANLRLEATKIPTQRFSIGIEVQSSTAGPSSTGGYTIVGTLVPASDVSIPVKVCRPQGGRSICTE
jgi:hypothetical protein